MPSFHLKTDVREGKGRREAICSIIIISRSAHLRLYLPALNAHGQHTCISAFSVTWLLQRPSPVKHSFICQTRLRSPGDLIPAKGCHSPQEESLSGRFVSTLNWPSANRNASSQQYLDFVSLTPFEIPTSHL